MFPVTGDEVRHVMAHHSRLKYYVCSSNPHAPLHSEDQEFHIFPDPPNRQCLLLVASVKSQNRTWLLRSACVTCVRSKDKNSLIRPRTVVMIQSFAGSTKGVLGDFHICAS